MAQINCSTAFCLLWYANFSNQELYLLLVTFHFFPNIDSPRRQGSQIAVAGEDHLYCYLMGLVYFLSLQYQFLSEYWPAFLTTS